MKPTRRQIIKAAATTAVAAPLVLTAKRTSAAIRWGHGDFQYEFNHAWARLPEQYSWQTTHDVAIDRAGLIYVIHEGKAELKDHPSIFVFDRDGNFVRAFGQQFQGGGHGLEIRTEGSEEFIYVAAYQQVKSIAKLTLMGEVVWQRYAPMESGIYAKNEDSDRQKIWGRDRFMPTNFAFLPEGDFFLADGYGSYYIHRYTKDGQWKSCFGGPGDGDGKFNTPHGLWVDQRSDQPVLVVTDRAHDTLQYLNLDGNHLRTQEGFGLPANIDRQNDLLLVPELYGRVSILGKDNAVLASLATTVTACVPTKGTRFAAIPDNGTKANSFTHTMPVGIRRATSTSPSGSAADG